MDQDSALRLAYEALDKTINLYTDDYEEMSKVMDLQVEALTALAEVLGLPLDLSGAVPG